MNAIRSMSVGAMLLLAAERVEAQGAPTSPRPMLVMHGGATSRPREKMDPGVEQKLREGLETALRTGYEVLQRDRGTSVDAVEAAIRVLEDSPVFNAGKGAVFTHEGRNELDASIMSGRDRRAGAVAGVTRIKNPISAARAVMEKSAHVLLVGDGADRFAIHLGLEEVSPVYFWTPERWKLLQEDIAKEGQQQQQRSSRDEHDAAFGTVGAVALDREGNLAAGTSTGGTSNKRPGRVGDSPIIGAGTYADELCAVSCTGHGEVFIRYAVAHDIAARMRYKGVSIREAAEEALRQLPPERDGAGGLIALDRHGKWAAPYNTRALFHGWIVDGKVQVILYEK